MATHEIVTDEIHGSFAGRVDMTRDELLSLAERALAPCLMCWGTGATPRYRGPRREGLCIHCDGTGLRGRATMEASNG